mmetsp:Transcript_16450/g.27807  ORF Transcript_16450/g.27807 Transcript_16450/m.27807 type:complete len:205 (-) Transcript_16450:103-717(-)
MIRSKHRKYRNLRLWELLTSFVPDCWDKSVSAPRDAIRDRESIRRIIPPPPIPPAPGAVATVDSLPISTSPTAPPPPSSALAAAMVLRAVFMFVSASKSSGLRSDRPRCAEVRRRNCCPVRTFDGLGIFPSSPDGADPAPAVPSAAAAAAMMAISSLTSDSILCMDSLRSAAVPCTGTGTDTGVGARTSTFSPCSPLSDPSRKD